MCYAKWALVSEEIQAELDKHDFHLIQVPNNRKNCLDSKLMIDVVDSFHLTPFSHFWLISSDGDFYPLCQTLLAKSVKIALLSKMSHTSKDLQAIFYEKYYIDEYGSISRFIRKNQDEIHQIIQWALVDANNAVNQLLNSHQEFGKPLYTYEQWFTQYQNISSYRISPLVVAQLLPIFTVFKELLNTHGYPHDGEYKYFYPAQQNSPCPETLTASLQFTEKFIEIRYPLIEHQLTSNDLNFLKSAAYLNDAAHIETVVMRPEIISAAKQYLKEIYERNPIFSYISFDRITPKLAVLLLEEIGGLKFDQTTIPTSFYDAINPLPGMIKTNLVESKWEILARLNDLDKPSSSQNVPLSRNLLQIIKEIIQALKKDAPHGSITISKVSNQVKIQTGMVQTQILQKAQFSTFKKAIAEADKVYRLGIHIVNGDILW
jgi:hypothetical protein